MKIVGALDKTGHRDSRELAAGDPMQHHSWQATWLAPVVGDLSLSPIEEVRRDRLDTADTAPIRNGPIASPKSAASRIPEEDALDGCKDGNMIDDNASVISSLSNDDSGVMHIGNGTAMPVLTEQTDQHGLAPPIEVTIPVHDEKVHALPWRRKRSNLSSLSSSSAVPRPTLGRHQSAPAQPMDFSIATMTTSSQSISTMESLIQTLSMQNEDMTATSRLLGERPRRAHRRAKSAAAVSVGTFVGQSSLTPTLVTASATSDSTYTGNERSMALLSQGKKLGCKTRRTLSKLTGAEDRVCCVSSIESKFRKRNVVADELKHVLKKVVGKPLGAGRKEEIPTLKRASGSLA